MTDNERCIQLLEESIQNNKEIETLKRKVEKANGLAEAVSELHDTQDHEDWCGHGKAGCLMCKVIEKILEELTKWKEG